MCINKLLKIRSIYRQITIELNKKENNNNDKKTQKPKQKTYFPREEVKAVSINLQANFNEEECKQAYGERVHHKRDGGGCTLHFQVEEQLCDN